jgi:hypothetical protein
VELLVPVAVAFAPNFMEAAMADGNSGASGILGVLVGAMIVIFVGAAILYSTGKIGSRANTSSFTIKLPTVTR